MLREAWRYHRDFFYDPSMHGQDWAQVWRRHAEWLPRLNGVNDLGFALRELSGELGAGHVVASATPRSRETNPQRVGLLGADVERRDGTVRIARVLDAGLRSPEQRSPLAAPGVNVRAGDVLLAINGKSVQSIEQVRSVLAGKPKSVALLVQRDGNKIFVPVQLG